MLTDFWLLERSVRKCKQPVSDHRHEKVSTRKLGQQTSKFQRAFSQDGAGTRGVLKSVADVCKDFPCNFISRRYISRCLFLATNFYRKGDVGSFTRHCRLDLMRNVFCQQAISMQCLQIAQQIYIKKYYKARTYNIKVTSTRETHSFTETRHVFSKQNVKLPASFTFSLSTLSLNA